MKTASQLCFEVADLSVMISTPDPSFRLEVGGAMKDFLAEEDQPDVRVSVAWSDLSEVSLGSKVFDSKALWRLYRQNGSYLYCFTSSIFGPLPYKVATFNSDFTRGRVLLHRDYLEPEQPLYPLEYPLDELLMGHLLGQGLGAEVHGCGLVDAQGEGHLFVGQSGAGKSTMARLWDQVQGAEILSDDRIVLRKFGRKLWMYGTPWHGEAGFSSAARASLSRIYFLQQGQKNELLPTPPAEAVARLFASSFPPFYSPRGLDFTLEFFEEVVTAVPCAELRFLPDERVVQFISEVTEDQKQ